MAASPAATCPARAAAGSKPSIPAEPSMLAVSKALPPTRCASAAAGDERAGLPVRASTAWRGWSVAAVWVGWGEDGSPLPSSPSPLLPSHYRMSRSSSPCPPSLLPALSSLPSRRRIGVLLGAAGA